MKKLIFIFSIILLSEGALRSQCAGSCTNYTVSAITYSLSPPGGTNLFLGDDQVSGAVPIGFAFTFMCDAYTTLYVSSNGFLSFNPTVGNGCCSGQLCPTNGGNPNNYVALAWTDLYPPGNGFITYQTQGVAPNRVFVLTFSNTPFCCGATPAASGQIKLFETSNNIEIHTTNVICCNTKTQGIMNQAGTVGYPAPGRNANNWTATNSAYLWSVPSGSMMGNANICQGATTIYSVAAMPGALSYSWSLPAGWTGSSSTETIAATPGASGVLTVTGTFTCGVSTPTTLNVTVNPAPPVSISGGNTAVCPGNAVNLVGGGALTYSWSNGATGTMTTINPTVSGTYSVIGVSAAGCTASAVKDITVTPGPPVAISGTNQICQGNSVLFTAGGATSYTWSTGSNSTTITAMPSGNTSYTLWGNTGGPCNGFAIVDVTVHSNPIISIAGSNTACAGAVTLTAGGGNTYTWSTGSNSPVMTDAPNASTTYSVIGTNTNTGCYSSASMFVNVMPAPSVVIYGPNAMCMNQTITLNGMGADTYTWSNGANSQSIVISPPGNISYSLAGTYTASGCYGNLATKNITVHPNPTVNINASSSSVCKGTTATLTASGADTYSWSNGSLNQSMVVAPSLSSNYTVMGTSTLTGCYHTTTINISVYICTGIGNSQVDVSELRVHPNPNNGEFMVELKDGLRKHVEVFDMMGRSVFSNSTEEDAMEVNISSLVDGIYYVKVQSEEVSKVIKIIKH
jgi:hypothetical protein